MSDKCFVIYMSDRDIYASDIFDSYEDAKTWSDEELPDEKKIFVRIEAAYPGATVELEYDT